MHLEVDDGRAHTAMVPMKVIKTSILQPRHPFGMHRLPAGVPGTFDAVSHSIASYNICAGCHRSLRRQDVDCPATNSGQHSPLCHAVISLHTPLKGIKAAAEEVALTAARCRHLTWNASHQACL